MKKQVKFIDYLTKDSGGNPIGTAVKRTLCSVAVITVLLFLVL